MVAIVPLRLRTVSPEWTDRVPSPAHDSMSAAERRTHLEKCPESYFAVTRSIEDLPADVDMTINDLLHLGKDSLEELLGKNTFSELREEAMYVYRLDNGVHSQTGVLCGTRTSAFADGEIRAHERVFGAQRDHLAKHFQIVAMQSSPIVMAHEDMPDIAELIADALETSPLVDFVSPDGLRQSVWMMENSASTRVAELLAEKPLYIIDGHHRTGAAEAYLFEAGEGPAEHMLTAVFPASQMRSLAFHRWLRSEDDCRWLFEGMEDHFETRDLDVANLELRSPDELAIYHDGKWTAVLLPLLHDGDALSRLDPVQLQRHLLGPLVGIDESAPRNRLDYIAGILDVGALTERIDTAGGALVFMRPVEMWELFDVADAGQIMPPKSTYFVPKARSGVVLRPL